MDPEEGQGQPGIMHIPWWVWVAGAAVLAYFLFFRNSSSSDAAGSTSGGGGTITSGNTTVDSGAVTISVNTNPQPTPPTKKKTTKTTKAMPSGRTKPVTTTNRSKPVQHKIHQIFEIHKQSEKKKK